MRNKKIRMTTEQPGKIAVTLIYAQHPVIRPVGADNPSYIRRIKSINGYRWNSLGRIKKWNWVMTFS